MKDKQLAQQGVEYFRCKQLDLPFCISDPIDSEEEGEDEDLEESRIYLCNNYMYGCSFIAHSQDILDRHESWLCTGPVCLQCFDEFDPDSRIEHLESHHVDIRPVACMLPGSNDHISKLFSVLYEMEDCQMAIKNCHGRTFIAVFEFKSDRNTLLVTTDESPENIRYTIKYRISSTDNKFEHFGDLDNVKNNNEQMFWYSEFPKFEDPLCRFRFAMTVKKWII